MGNSGSSDMATAAAASGAIEAKIKKEKARAKKVGCCCCWCNVFAIVFFVTGIVLLVYFATALGDNYKPDATPSQNVAKGLSYTGIAFIILGLIMLLVGIAFAVALYVSYRKLNGKSSTKVFVPPQYAPGTAPYPEQDWGEGPNPHHPAGPVEPQQPGQPALDTDTITPVIR